MKTFTGEHIIRLFKRHGILQELWPMDDKTLAKVRAMIELSILHSTMYFKSNETGGLRFVDDKTMLLLSSLIDLYKLYGNSDNADDIRFINKLYDTEFPVYVFHPQEDEIIL